MRVLLASSNPHKATEFRRLFQNTSVRLCTPDEIGAAAVHAPETGLTFLENATIKAEAYLQAYRMATLADDSGICVDALAGAPGVRSARFGRPNFDDPQRMHYLLRCLTGIPPVGRGAHYVCELVVAQPEADIVNTRGALYGTIATEPSSGSTGFGYDPVFMIPGLGKTVAEVTPQEKDSLSHRGKALRMLLVRLGLSA